MTTNIDRYYAAACQLDMPNAATRNDIGKHTARMLEMIEHAVVGYRHLCDVRLVVFPEFGHAAPIYDTVDKLLDRLAIPIPNEHTAAYQRKAREFDVYIQTGTFLEVDPRWPGHVFNTTCLIGPDGIIAKYRKVNPWIPWEVHTSPHDLVGYDEPMFPVADTPIGKLGVAICYDWLFPEVLRQLALNGAEILIRVSAYMDPWGTATPLDWWTLVNRTRALENMCYVVAANQAASRENYPPFSWPGGSMIVDYDGRILSQADPGPGEKIVVGPIDLAALRAERARRQTHHLLSQLRIEAYTAYQQPIYPRNDARQFGPMSIEANLAAIQQGRANLARIAESKQESGTQS
jgi:predicted amidohydrolase